MISRYIKSIIFALFFVVTIAAPMSSKLECIKTISLEDEELEVNDVFLRRCVYRRFLYIIKSKKNTGMTKFIWDEKKQTIELYRVSKKEKEKYIYTIDIWDMQTLELYNSIEHCSCECWGARDLVEKNPHENEKFDYRVHTRGIDFYDTGWNRILEVDFKRDCKKIVWSQDFKKTGDELVTTNKEETLFVTYSKSEIKIFKPIDTCD